MGGGERGTTIFLWGVAGLLKNAVCSNGICWNEKKFLFLKEGSSEKKELCECHGGGVD